MIQATPAKLVTAAFSGAIAGSLFAPLVAKSFVQWLPVLACLLAGGILWTVLVAKIEIANVFVCSLLLICLIGGYSWFQLNKPLPASIQCNATLRSDVKPKKFDSEVIVSCSNRLYLLRLKGEQREMLATGLSGDRFSLSGTPVELDEFSATYLRRRHVAGLIRIDELSELKGSSAIWTIPNGIRQVIERGAQCLPKHERALLTGFVYGDDRFESDQTKEEFRETGLSHLLAVSGQNVAFIILIVSAAVTGLNRRKRQVAIVASIGVFALCTRFEPSVIRACLMALLSLKFATSFLPGDSMSIAARLQLAVVIALLVDPFLIGSIGFLLSVFAVVGMITIGRYLADNLGGPTWLRLCMSYTTGAQIGVLPIQLIVFKTVPMAGLVANVLVEPFAGAIMVWGVVAGTIAGMFELADLAMVSSWIHWPTRLMLNWIVMVAHLFSELTENTVIGYLIGAGSVLILFGSWVIGRKNRIATSRQIVRERLIGF